MDNPDPRVRRTRKLLHQALGALLKEKNFDLIRVQEIARLATINRATFYDHYRDKIALFNDIVSESFKELLDSRFAENVPSTDETLRLLILTVCDYLCRLPAHWGSRANDALTTLLVEDKLKSIIHDLLLSSLLQSRHPHDRESADLSATLASWSLYGACRNWSLDRPGKDTHEFAAGIVPLITLILARKISSSPTNCPTTADPTQRHRHRKSIFKPLA